MNELIKKITAVRQKYESELPGIEDGRELIERCLALLLPYSPRQQGRNTGAVSEAEIKSAMEELDRKVDFLLSLLKKPFPIDSREVKEKFMANLPALQTALLEDARAIDAGDPASSGIEEVIIAYPGFYAIAVHRIAHTFFTLKVPILPRLLSEYAHRITGIDIHPAAEIGRNFCIDHGTGIVIGATSTIHDNVKIYQGVTLGALSVEKSLANKKRHPTIEENVVIYANATILGGETVIGANSVVGGNVWLTESIPKGTTVYHSGERTIRKS